jgi:hypothetical protein
MNQQEEEEEEFFASLSMTIEYRMEREFRWSASTPSDDRSIYKEEKEKS